MLLVLAAAIGASGATPAHAQSAGEPTVFAGTGTRGSSGDGGPATQAKFDYPYGVARAGNGTVYISDLNNHTVRAVVPDGTIRTVAGTGEVPPTPDMHDGAPATEFPLSSPTDLAAAPDGSLYITDIGLGRIFRLTTDGHIRLVAGDGFPGYAGDGGPATAAQMGRPVGLAVAADGTLYFGDPEHHRVRRVTPDGTISTIAGNGSSLFYAAGGPATTIPAPAVLSLALDHTGNLWMVDAGYPRRLSGGRIVTITESGKPDGGQWKWQSWGTSDTADWPPPNAWAGALAVAADGASAYVLTQDGLFRLDADQLVEQIADVHGPGIQPMTAAAGTVYLADGYRNQVYAIHPAPPPATPATSSTPRWPLPAAGLAALLIGLLVLGVQRKRRVVRSERTQR